MMIPDITDRTIFLLLFNLLKQTTMRVSWSQGQM